MNLSVLIPVYRVEPYIERCARSLMQQTFTDGIEFIFIDDASPDRSIEILENVIEEYPSRKNQVRLIRHIKNHGVASTRTQAIREATGEYIGWCDSDDWCEPDMFLTLYNKAVEENADIVTCGYYCDSEEKTERVLRTYPIIGKDYLEKLYTYPDTFCSLCDKIVRRDVYIKNDIVPFPDIDVSEDMNVMFRLFFYAQRVCVVPFYFYHINCTSHSSITHSVNRKYIFQQDYRNNALICSFLQSIDLSKYRLSCNYLKFLTKIVSERVFDNKRKYFQLYQETHRDILLFSGKPLLLRLKFAICYSCYPMFRICSFLARMRNRIIVYHNLF